MLQVIFWGSEAPNSLAVASDLKIGYGVQTMRIHLSILFLILSFVACSSDKSSTGQKSLSKQKVQVLLEENSLGKKEPAAILVNRQIKLLHELQWDGGLLTVVIKGDEPLSQEEMQSMMLGLSKDLPRAKEPLKVFRIDAPSSRGGRWNGHVYRVDMDLYAKGELSEPEMLRRMELTFIETLESLEQKTFAQRNNLKNEEALESVKKWIDMEPTSLVALSLQGNILRDLKLYWEAISVYEKLQKLGYDPLFVDHNLAYVYEKLGAYDDAIKYYKKAIALDENNFTLMKQLAQVYGKSGEYNGAMVWLGRAKEIKTDADINLIEGNLQRLNKNYDQAKQSYLKGLKNNDGDGRFYFNLVLISLDKIDIKSAKIYMAQLLDKDPALAHQLKNIPLAEGSDS